jgi:hypothetical protein
MSATQGSVTQYLRYIALILRHFSSRVKDYGALGGSGEQKREEENTRKMLDADSP